MTKKKWIKVRHQIVIETIRIFMRPIAYFYFGFRYKRFKNHKQPYFIMHNHQTVWDQFLIGLIWSNKTYFIMSDDLTTIKFLSPIMKFLVNPIPYKKASTDFTILRTCKQVVQEGGSIVIAAEGNRTYSGKTEYINPTIVKMIKFLKIPIATIRIEGGYGIFPRWANKKRKGRFYGSVYKTYSYEDYKDMSDKKLYDILCEDLYVDESTEEGPYKSSHSAEYLERVIYNCPKCGFTTFQSHKQILHCTTCNMMLRYNEYKQFEGINIDAPFKNVNEWYEYQKIKLFDMKLMSYDTNYLFFEDKVKFIEVLFRKSKKIIDKNAIIKMYSNRIEVIYQEKKSQFLFDKISSSGVFGKNKLNFYVDKYILQFKGNHSFNAMKYVNLFYKYKIEKGDVKNDKFLGL